MYGKQTERAIAAMSRLAEVWDGGETRLSALEIARHRGLPAPMVAKLLTALAQAGLVRSLSGPRGGYALARSPEKICLHEVFAIFEREDTSPECPFGAGVCGAGAPCALHDRLVEIQSTSKRLLRETTFEAFRAAAQDQGLVPVPAGSPTRSPERESYRAPKRTAT